MLTTLQAWMRARGDAAGSVFTADTIADKYGVVKGSYTSIALPNSESYQVTWSFTLSSMSWAARYNTWLLSKLTPKGLTFVFSPCLVRCVLTTLGAKLVQCSTTAAATQDHKDYTWFMYFAIC
jgi:hypothetical protein